MNCAECVHELTSVYASRSVELQRDGDHWIEKNVFSSTVSCPNCHEALSDEEIGELNIKGY